MKSRAHIKGHPIHQILVPFPIAFFTATFILDLVFYFSANSMFAEMARYAEAGGIISAMLAAVPGAVDYFASVPPESSAQKRAGKHALLNSSMLFVFIMALLLRRNSEVSFLIIILLEGLGFILLTIAGWLGGTLVIRNQIGVDHRYADAGKWNEEFVTGASGKSIELKDPDKLKVNQMKLVHVDNKRIVIARTEDDLVAFEDRCTHRGGSLADGALICGTVQCPWHGSQFDVKSGRVQSGPAKENISVFQLTCRDKKYYLEL